MHCFWWQELYDSYNEWSDEHIEREKHITIDFVCIACAKVKHCITCETYVALCYMLCISSNKSYVLDIM